MRFGRISFSPLSLLLGFVPAAALLDWRDAPGLWLFLVSSLAIIPLAGLMGEATEHLAARLGAGLGGILNATFGNAAELIIALLALRRGLLDVVKASLTGSIIGNLLLVAGLALLCGGLRHREQRFNSSAAGVGVAQLVLAAAGLIMPALFYLLVPGAHDSRPAHFLSFEIAIVLGATYCFGLVFTLRTHRHLFAGAEHHTDPGDGVTWSKTRSLTLLVAATAGVAWMSEILVGSIEQAAETVGLSHIFVGVILVAIVGNAAEHSTAVLMAMRNKMDLAMTIAVGSSIQVALLIAPVLVFASWLMGQPMDLVFTPLEVASVGLAVGVFSVVALDGKSNWMEGLLLLAVYTVLALAFFNFPVAAKAH